MAKSKPVVVSPLPVASQPGPNDLVLDFTILSATAECETRAYVEHACGLVPRIRGLALEAGKSIHAALAIFLPTRDKKALDRGMKVAEGYGVCEAAARARGEEVPPQYGTERVLAVLRQWLGRNLGAAFPFVVYPKLIEQVVAVPFRDADGVWVTTKDGRRVWYAVRLDAAVRRHESGVKWSMDHKSANRITDWKIDKWKSSAQFTGQLHVLEEEARMRDEEPSVGGIVVNGIELPAPHTSQRKCPEHAVPYVECSVKHAGGTYVYITRTPAELAAWRDTAEALIARTDRLLTLGASRGIGGVEEVPMRGRWTGACAFCDVKPWCDAGRPTSQRVLDLHFKKYGWDPMVGETE